MPITSSFRLNKSAPLRILQLSDFHFLERPGQTLMGIDTEQSFKEVLRHLRTHPHWPPDLVLLTGDLVQDPSQNSYGRLLTYLANFEMPWICLPGNHDHPACMEEILCREGVHCAKHVLTNEWQIICLNSQRPGSHGGHLNTKELKFLAQCLDSHPNYSALIALHHPPIPVGSTWMDTMQLENSEDFLAVLERFSQVKGVMFGHVHQLFEIRYGSIPLWSTPSTCFQFKPGSQNFALDNQPPGWRWFELGRNGHLHTWVERLDNAPEGLDFSLAGY